MCFQTAKGNKLWDARHKRAGRRVGSFHLRPSSVDGLYLSVRDWNPLHGEGRSNVGIIVDGGMEKGGN